MRGRPESVRLTCILLFKLNGRVRKFLLLLLSRECSEAALQTIIQPLLLFKCIPTKNDCECEKCLNVFVS